VYHPGANQEIISILDHFFVLAKARFNLSAAID